MEYKIYKSKYTGKHVDDAIDQIPNKLDKQTAQTESDQVYGKLADGSQTMFDVTMGATATTIPRRDTAGRIQVADGVSGSDAVNFNQLQAVESSISGLNIQNGTGTGSLVQTNVVSSSGTPYTNRATGSGAIALGKNCWSGGNTAFTIGQQNKTGNNSGTGDSNSGKGGFTHGYNNINEGHYTEVGGSGNFVEGAGADTIVNGRNNHIIKSNHSAVFGDTNRVDSTYNPNNGADDNIVGGKNNNVGSSGNIVGGESNTAHGNNNSLIIGSHNSINTNSSGDRIVGGHYNKPVANGLMEIGNGTSNTDRKNAFVVLEDGRAKVQTAPKDANDVVIKQYADDNFVKINKPIAGTYAYVCSKDNYSTVYKIAVEPEAWTIPGRKDGGRIEVGDPVDNSDATTKSYVDTQINSSTTMYRHSISYLGTSDEGVIVKIYLTVISSTNLVVDSLSALKVLIGNTFTYSATGAVLKTLQQELYQVVAITDTQVKTIFNSGFIDINYPTGRWSDDVTTV